MDKIPQIDVCVATFKRPILLYKLLQSLQHQKTDGLFTYSILVVDNDQEERGRAVVEAFAQEGLPITYDIERIQNIARVRNLAIKLSKGDYIAFIDDDEEADPNWLIHLFRTINDYEADAVVGQVISVFADPNVPEYVRHLRPFKMTNPPTGSISGFVRCGGNCLFKRSLVKADSMPFDIDFGHTGGSDSVFFEKLEDQGRKIVYCREAIVRELVPEHRSQGFWRLNRFYRNGNITYLMFRKKIDGNIRVEIIRKKLQFGFKLLRLTSKLLGFEVQQIFTGKNEKVKRAEILERLAFTCGFMMSTPRRKYKYYK